MKRSNSILLVLGGVVAGGICGLLFAPQSGRRTRSMIKDKSVKYSHDVGDFAGKKSRHVANKAKGLVHEARTFFSDRIVARETKVPEEVSQT